MARKSRTPDATARHVGAEAVGRADDLTARDSAPAEDQRDGAGPVVAARLRHPGARVLGVADPGCAAELAGHHDQDATVEAARIDVLDQGGHGLVEVAAARLHGVEDVVIHGVVVPVADPAAERAVQAGRHQVHAGLDQPARQQAALAPGVAPVAVAEPGILAVQVERPARLGAREQGVRLLMEGVEGLGLRPVVERRRNPSNCAARLTRRPIRSICDGSRRPSSATRKSGAFGSP